MRLLRFLLGTSLWCLAASFSEHPLRRQRTQQNHRRVVPSRPVRNLRRFSVVDPPKPDVAEASGVTSVATSADLESSSEDHMSLTTLLSDYGLIALGFHFSVWLTSLTAVYSLLSAGFEFEMPEVLQSLFGDSSPADGEDFSEAAAAGAGAARLAATLAFVEAVGPFRLGLTIAATPSVSKWARQYAAVRSAEAALTLKVDQFRETWEESSRALEAAWKSKNEGL